MNTASANLSWKTIETIYDVPEESGVYRFLDKRTGETIYVGSSFDLNQRMKSYSVIINKIYTVEVQYCLEGDRYQYLEMDLISELSPLGNSMLTNHKDDKMSKIDIEEYKLMVGELCSVLSATKLGKPWLAAKLKIPLSMFCRKILQSYKEPSCFTEKEISKINTLLNSNFKIPYKKVEESTFSEIN